jgi:hypothetical protein
MPWVIAIMIALTVVAAASALALRHAAQAASADLEGGVTVQIVSAAPAQRQREAQAALGVLRHARRGQRHRRAAGELDAWSSPGWAPARATTWMTCRSRR